MDATVTIVSFNTRDKLADCLRSIDDTRGGLALEVIVIDNGSKDGSVEMVAHDFPHVQVIATGENLGFGRAHNRGLARAGGRHLIVLNPDTIVLPGTFARLVAFMDATPDAAACGCTVLDAARTLAPSGHRDHSLVSLVGNVFNLRAVLPRDEVLRQLPFMRRVHGAYDPHDRIRTVDWIDGACLVVRRTVYEQIGGFDEGIFLNGEDFDWCVRMRQAGWRVYHVPDVALVHLMHQSKDQFYVRSFVEYYRSYLYLFRKHHGPVTYAVSKGVILTGFAWRWIVATVARAFGRARPLRDTEAFVAVLQMALSYHPVPTVHPAATAAGTR